MESGNLFSDRQRNSGDRVIDRFPGRTEADMFIWMWRKEPEMQVSCTPTSVSRKERAPLDSLRRIFRKLSPRGARR